MNRLKECREKSGLSQKTVAASLKVAAPSVSNWESGKTSPTHENLEKLADLYGVSIDYLLGRESPVSAENGQKEKAPAGEPAEAPSRDQMIEDIIRIYRQMSDAEKLDFLARLNAPKEP